jgi:hypothetical protein
MEPTNNKLFIDKLCTFSNNNFIYDETYIKNKYNLNSYDKFRKYFKKHHGEKLIFNSEKAEHFFIKIMNIDYKYILKKYNSLDPIINFFVLHNQTFFNECEEFTDFNEFKTHCVLCNCKIKVKSVVNLSINALVFIIGDNFNSNINLQFDFNNSYTKPNNISNKNFNIPSKPIQNEKSQIIKIFNNNINKKILNCINEMENAKLNLGIAKDNVIYQLTDTKPNCKLSNINNQPNLPNPSINNASLSKYKNLSISTFTHQTKIFQEIKRNLNPNKNINDQLFSDSSFSSSDIDTNFTGKTKGTSDKSNWLKSEDKHFDFDDIEEDQSGQSTEKSLEQSPEKSLEQSPEKSLEQSPEKSLEKSPEQILKNKSQIFNKLGNFDEELFKQEEPESNVKKRFGNVIIADNKVKIEKKEPEDLNNSSDILISYNEYSRINNIGTNNFIIGNLSGNLLEKSTGNNLETIQENCQSSPINKIQVEQNQQVNKEPNTKNTIGIIPNCSNSSNSTNNKNPTEKNSLDSKTKSKTKTKSKIKTKSKSKSDEDIKSILDKLNLTEQQKNIIIILKNLDTNFNYITSDDILVDDNKKNQISSFMVDTKYKLHDMFRYLEKIINVDLAVKNKILNDYEKIHNYVMYSNKIGNTSEMVEFSKNKELIWEIINEILYLEPTI